MKFNVDDVKKFKEASQELIDEVEENLESDNVEDTMFVYDENAYCMVEIGRDKEIDEGKYTVGCKYYQLVSIDTSIAKYPRKDNIIDKFNIVVSSSYSKCGSYFIDYELEYDEPQIGVVSLKIVPEVVIPEHEEVDINYSC